MAASSTEDAIVGVGLARKIPLNIDQESMACPSSKRMACSLSVKSTGAISEKWHNNWGREYDG